MLSDFDLISRKRETVEMKVLSVRSGAEGAGWWFGGVLNKKEKKIE
jgi:hypothetical protein